MVHSIQPEFGMQSVLITGSGGFIGQNLVHAWHAAHPADRLVVVDAMTYAANIRSLEPLIAERSIQFVKGDIRDAALMRDLFEEQAAPIRPGSTRTTDSE
jgi:dTDP-glucose 4,6-dehydratase